MELTAARLYRRALAEHWVAYVIGTLALLVTSVTEVLAPKFAQWSIDVISRHGAATPHLFTGDSPRRTLDHLMVGFIALLFVALLGRWGWRQTLARRTHEAGYSLRLRLWDVLRFEPLKTLHRYPLGDIMNRATGDVNAGRFIHGFTLAITYDLVFFTVLALISMFGIDAELTLYCLVVFPLLPRVVVRLARREHDQHNYAQEKLSQLSDFISQALGTVRLQRATATEAVWQKRLGAEAKEYANRRLEVLKTGWKIFPLGAVPTLVAYAVLLTWGVHKIEANRLSIGGFIALQTYVVLLQVPLFELGSVISEWQKGFASLGRIVEILRLGQPRNDAYATVKADLANVASGIVVKGLSFSFENRPVLHDISFTVASGERVGILGPIGSGKSTLLSLLSGLLEPPPGQVLVGGVDATQGQALSTMVAMVPQKAFLFAGSIRRNLSLSEAFPEEELWRVLEIVNLAKDVRQMPSGLESWIGEWGINLSGGQKQRLALARALLRPKPILLLDDCLSAVDAVTEEQILRAIDRHLAGKAIVWVAHRRSTLALCQRIYNLQSGRLYPAT